MAKMATKFSILMVDDDEITILLLKELITDENYQVFTASDGHQALKLIEERKIDAALLDYIMPGMNGLELLKEIKKRYPDIMCVMLTSHGEIELAVKAMKLGAVDFIEKPFSSDGLQARVAQLFQIWKLKRENHELKLKLETRFDFDDFVGHSTAIMRVKDTIARVGASDVTVLIQGETGTGKELVALAVHKHSSRSQQAFVPVDCASISETVIESELFGHVKGAYTGAHTDTIGLIRSADKGTIFLDEIGELSPAVQSNLLRSIQEKTVRPVGSDKSYKVDIRVIAATNKNLKEEVEQGHFRNDLFYRINVMIIDVPPLRERKEDIQVLSEHFLKSISNEPRPVKKILPTTMHYLYNYDWPGNIRELENVIERAVAVKEGDDIFPVDLPGNIYNTTNRLSEEIITSIGHDSLSAYEIAAIKNALSKCGNNRKMAAQTLEIGEATLYRKLKKYSIIPK